MKTEMELKDGPSQQCLYLAQVIDIYPEGVEQPSANPELLLGDLVGYPLRKFDAKYLRGGFEVAASGASSLREDPQSEIDALYCMEGSKPWKLVFRPIEGSAGRAAPGLYVLFGFREVNGERVPFQRPEIYLGKDWQMPRSIRKINLDMKAFAEAYEAEGPIRSLIFRAADRWAFVDPPQEPNGELLVIPHGDSERLAIGCYPLLTTDPIPHLPGKTP